jgi:two-component system response regulator (stage 0 sporulation protein F)
VAKILVIEDDAAVRALYRDALAKAGHEVQEAADGREGVSLYRRAPADLILTDLLMPRKDGVETIRELRRDFPAVRIIAITGARGIYNRLPAASHLGAQRSLTKPVSLEELVRAVREVMEE